MDLGGGTSWTFGDQNIDIAWGPTTGTKSGRGQFQIARVTLSDLASGSWTLMGLQAGANDDVIFTLSGDIGLLPGDVDGNGYVSAPDLTIVISNWGMSGAIRTDGDLDGDGTVSAPDYTEVITYWGTGTPPEPGPVPEPATLAVLGLSAFGLLVRRRRC